jgi:hypothetical protein
MTDQHPKAIAVFLCYRAKVMKFSRLAVVLITLGFLPSLGGPAAADAMPGRQVVGAAAVATNGSARSAVDGRLLPNGRGAVPTRLNSSLSGSRVRLKH